MLNHPHGYGGTLVFCGAKTAPAAEKEVIGMTAGTLKRILCMTGATFFTAMLAVAIGVSSAEAAPHATAPTTTVSALVAPNSDCQAGVNVLNCSGGVPGRNTAAQL
ncbi:hypothetical protein ACFVFJ_11745 [Streptomyces sp. NPDC057717]|uniref:hypothetical protein n=1 Tax=Streptomyces sp. NPDC057717 TaxID=3346224 RepID=UPI0036CFC2FE